MNMENVDIRVMISEKGLRYTDIAKQLGISRQYLSLLMRFKLTAQWKQKIEQAIEHMTNDKKQRERLNLLIPAEIKKYLYAAAYRESNEKHTVSVTEYLCNLVEEDMKKHKER